MSWYNRKDKYVIKIKKKVTTSVKNIKLLTVEGRVVIDIKTFNHFKGKVVID